MKLILFAVIQSIFLCAGQLFMKLALNAFERASWSWSFFVSQLTNWWWLACGVSFTAAGVLWMYRAYFPRTYRLDTMGRYIIYYGRLLSGSKLRVES